MDVLGLPLHPLVVHAAVVLVPLAALGALAVVLIPRARERYGGLTVAFAVAAAVATVVARLSGEDLGGGFGQSIAAHRAWGELAPFPAVALAVLLPIGLLVRRSGTSTWWRLLGILIALASVAALVLVVLTGHSGAVAVWGRAG